VHRPERAPKAEREEAAGPVAQTSGAASETT
jgi:hypothetical protein